MEEVLAFDVKIVCGLLLNLCSQINFKSDSLTGLLQSSNWFDKTNVIEMSTCIELAWFFNNNLVPFLDIMGRKNQTNNF
jgi:hypothetical protein